MARSSRCTVSDESCTVCNCASGGEERAHHGAGHGIGAATARELAARSARLALIGLEPEALAALATELGDVESGGHHTWAEADVTDSAALSAAVGHAVTVLGGLDVVVASDIRPRRGSIELSGRFAACRSESCTVRSRLECGSATMLPPDLSALRPGSPMTLEQTLHQLATWDRPVRLIATGGGTGGHTYPAITTIRATRELLSSAGVELDVLYVGSATGLEARVAEQEQLPFQAVSTGKLRRAANPVRMISRANLRDVGRLSRGIVEARRVVRAFRPDVVLSTGGYVAVPVGLAAKSAGAALLVHEQTTRLGLANRLLLRRATTIALSSSGSLELLPATARARAVVTGNPIRTELLNGYASRAVKALDWTGWDAARPTVYVTGGAQGAVQVNRLVAAVLDTLLPRANVVHQCGAGSLAEVTRRAEQLPAELAARYRVVGFVGPELPDVLALADVVVSRSGAGTLAELTALGKPSVLIPLRPTSGNEQEHNARYLQQAGAAHALLGERPTAEDLTHALDDLIGDASVRAKMANQAAQLGRPDAARNLAASLLDLANLGPGSRRTINQI